MRFVPRTCRHCGKGLGTLSFRWFERDGEGEQRGKMQRDYFHPDCFVKFKLKLDKPPQSS